MMNSTFKKAIPSFLFSAMLHVRAHYLAPTYYSCDKKRFLRFSGLRNRSNTEVKMLAGIAKSCHVLEKGLTMPKMRLGFGYEIADSVINQCNQYISICNSTNCHLLHAIGVLKEYLLVHQTQQFLISKQLNDRITELANRVDNCETTSQMETTSKQYFSMSNAPFDKFSASRHSLRNYSSDEIDINILIDAVKLAQNAPSSCNRQQGRAYIINDKETITKVLDCQNGHRGFGHLSNKLIVLTASVEEYSGIGERNSAFIDGGLFAMNLLYALHFKEIGVCTLNAYFSLENEKIMRRICGVPEQEVFLMVLTCGKAPDNFKVALSKRNNVERILRVI